MEALNIITDANDWLNSFKDNKNTGVEEEKKVGLQILLYAKLITYEDIPDKYKNIKKVTHYNNNILGIINITQNDNVGGSSDIGVKYTNNTIKTFSVTQLFNKNKITKCLYNASAKNLYNLSDTEDIKNYNTISGNMAIEYRKKKHGEIPNQKWKRCKGCPGSKQMCEFLANKASESWNKMLKEEKVRKIRKMLDIDDKLKTNSNGIIYWCNKTNNIEYIYKWEIKINIEDYLDSYSDSIYVYHGSKNDIIVKTQAKYNNGIIEGMSSKLNPEYWNIKISKNYLSSWNIVAPNLSKIFEMEEIKL